MYRYKAAGVLDDIRALLPAPDRFQTPPTTPLAVEEDNILADAFGFGGGLADSPPPPLDEDEAAAAAAKDKAEAAAAEANKAPAVPTMVRLYKLNPVYA